MVAPVHDMALFDELRRLALASAPDLREGGMFGCPALYVGRKLACCVMGKEIGLRVPQRIADGARTSGRARAFTPYGKRPMREWIALDLSPPNLHRADDLIREAVGFARKNNAHDK
jgi:hypothetical protein